MKIWPFTLEFINKTEGCMKHKYPLRHPVGHLLVGLFALASLVGCGQSDKPADKASPQLVDAVIQQLQDSGKLDTAVKDSIRHLLEERQQADAKAAESRRAQMNAKLSKMPAPNFGKEHLLGSPNAPVSLIEYADFECPFCKHFHETPQQVQQQFGEQVNLIYRSMPLSSHGEVAFLEARAGECAARIGSNDVFWKYSNDLFHYSQSNGKGLGDDQSIHTLAVKYKLDSDTFQACLDNPATGKILDHNLQTARDLGITGTPTTLVRNNKTGAVEVVNGAASAAQLTAAIEKVLK